ncbi:MAG: hypothetical protein MK213_07630, partial [Planctomycetes bacterium]|nr:hypothetical protein [Planctomycetota bacterium]
MLTSTHAITPYRPEPFTDFSNEENAAAFQTALQKIEASFPTIVRLWIDGEDCEGGNGTFESTDPSQTSRVVSNSA